jgi:formamidopyrimidine-DNA glycosylase
MPELPEVETIRRDLSTVLQGKKITDVVVRKRKLVRSNPRSFGLSLRGQVIGKIDRRGKLLIITLADTERYLLVHLKMTGQLIYQDKKQTLAGGHGWPIVEELPNKYSHIIFAFADGSSLFFNDMRQFGYMSWSIFWRNMVLSR